MEQSPDNAQFSVVDYVVFSSVLVLSSIIGLYYAWKARKTVDNREFLTGSSGKTGETGVMGVFPITLSLIASLMSAITMVGMPAETFSHSTQYMVSIGSVVVAVIVADQVFLPLFYKLQLPSVNKYLQRRSQRNYIRLATTASYVFGSFFYLGAVLYGPALSLSSVTPIPVTSSIILVGLVCTFYTTLGGMKAVVWTDCLQMVIMVAGLLMVAIKGVMQVGSFEEVIEINRRGGRLQLFRMAPDHEHGVAASWEIFLGMLMLWTGSMSTNQICVQRYCCVPTLKKARIALYMTAVGVSGLVVLACFCGVALYANYHDCDPLKTGRITEIDQLMPYFVVETLGSIKGLPGLFVAAVFSGSLSTLSSVLNAMTTLTWDDFLKKHIKLSKTKEMWVIKIIGILYGVSTIGLAFVAQRVGSVMQASVSLAGAIKGPLLGIFLMGAVCPFVNGKGMLAGLLAGQISCLFLNMASLIVEKPFLTLPTSTTGCMNTNITSMWNHTTFSEPSVDDLWWMHYISPFFVPFLGNIITISTAIVVSLLTRDANEEVDPEYVSHLVKGKLHLPECLTRVICPTQMRKNSLKDNDKRENGHVNGEVQEKCLNQSTSV